MKNPILLFSIFLGLFRLDASIDEYSSQMRQVAHDVSLNKISTETELLAQSVAKTLNLGCSGVGNSSGVTTPIQVRDGSVEAVAIVDEKPGVRCDVVRNGFEWAKAYWAELICITQNVVWYSKQEVVDYDEINRLVERAKILRGWIQQVFPVAWDRRDQVMLRSWKSIQQNVQLQFETDSLNWRGAYWKVPALPQGFQIDSRDNAIYIRQELSTISYCLEPQEGLLKGRLTVVGKEPLDSGSKVVPFSLWLP